MKEVTIYTDGAASGNPGPGGYGVVLQHGGRRRELSSGFVHTTNNRMEVLAAIAGLEALKQPCKVVLISDSRYLVDAMKNGWLAGWKARGWLKADRQPVKNVDLWKRLERAAARHRMEWRWIEGHAGHAENERCDALARAASNSGQLQPDTGWEQARIQDQAQRDLL